jgi:hypothetical protein
VENNGTEHPLVFNQKSGSLLMKTQNSFKHPMNIGIVLVMMMLVLMKPILIIHQFVNHMKYLLNMTTLKHTVYLSFYVKNGDMAVAILQR